MSALTSLLVRDEVVSVQKIEDALQRQVLEGGEIDTALLELSATFENTLNAYRAASFGLSPASRADLMEVERSLVELVPRALAEKHRVLPIGHRGSALVLACAHPVTAEAAAELSAHAYLPVEWRIATEVRVEAALALHYGIDIAPRMRRLAEQLAATEAGDTPEVDASLHQVSDHSGIAFNDEVDEDDNDVRGPSAVPLPPPTIVTEYGVGARAQPHDQPVAVSRVVHVEAPARAAVGVQETDTDDSTEPSIVPPIMTRDAALAQGSGEQAAYVEPATHNSPRVRMRTMISVPRGPLTKAFARELLEAADDRDQVIDVFFNYARQYFESTVLFAVREDRALGLESHNTPGVADVHEVSILFERGSTLEDLTRAQIPRVVDLSRKDADQALARALERISAQPCALIPVCIRQRVVSLVYGDRGGEYFRVDDIADLVELLPTVSQAFERIIRARKLFAMRARRPSVLPTAASSLDPQHSNAAPRAFWAAPPSGSERARRPTPPPSDIAGVFPGSRRPHEVPTPAQRRKSVPPLAPAATLSGMPSSTSKRTLTSRDVTGIATPRSPEAKRALSSLGVPRTAPPPPSASGQRKSTETDHALPRAGVSLEDLEQHPTVRLPAQTPDPKQQIKVNRSQPSAAGAGHYSKPPPGAGSYRSSINPPPDSDKDQDTSPAMPSVRASQPALDTRSLRGSRPSYHPPSPEEEPDTSEPQERTHAYPSKPPARSSKLPPGTGGTYKAHDVPTELVSLAPSAKIPEPAGKSSKPPSTYGSKQASVVSLPPSPRLPAEAAADGGKRTTGTRPSIKPRHSSAPITQPITPRRLSKPSPADARRENDAADRPEKDVVRMSKAVRDSLRSPAVSAEPSIIVDTGGQVRQLVIDLCRCGPDDEARFIEGLLRYGDEALPLLGENFPGPLWFDRRKPHPRLPMGRDVSAIARALSAFGQRASAQLATLLTSWDAETRFYATLLASDQVLPSLLSLLAERLFDADPQIRLIVKDVLPQYRDIEGFADVTRLLRERASDGRSPMQDRLAALDAIAVLRDVGSVPLLIRCNEDADRQISLPAHRSLVTITAQDFSTATRKWTSWYEENQDRHRVEWLIDSLMHSEQSLRATAGMELQKLTQVYYGYVATAPKRERERAQRRYMDWWQTQGKNKLR